MEIGQLRFRSGNLQTWRRVACKMAAYIEFLYIGWIAMLLYGATMFLSAFLLFLIQPMIGKYILPWFGGTPAVWTTCMLFFQALLLVGYAYAHALVRRFSLRRQARIHMVLVSATILVVLLFSIFPSPAWKPADGQSPVLRILGLLLASIGAPYLLLSATSPLLQSWFSRTHPAASPYRLYALSNIGSLLAILSYPLVIEPAIRLSHQGSTFSWIYAGFGLMCLLVSVKAMKTPLPESGSDAPVGNELPIVEPRPAPARYALWLSLTACSSIMLLATTGQLCQDLAVVPLLWILPLALYLLSFILCFQYERLYYRPLFTAGLAASIVWSCLVLYGGVTVSLLSQILSYSCMLFTACMVCHGELVRLKPGTRHLTSFYLMVAAGGSLGALLVTVGAPYVFKGFWEYHYGILITAMLTLIILFGDRKGPLYQGKRLEVWTLWAVILTSWIVLAPQIVNDIYKSRWFYLGLAALILVAMAAFLLDFMGRRYAQRPIRVWLVWGMLCASWLALAFVLRNHIQLSRDNSVAARRNFFGVLRVLDLFENYPGQHSLTLMHGRIEHGFQFQDPEKRYWPVSYYGPESGVGLAIGKNPHRLEMQPMRIGVIGLGTGTLAAYGNAGDTIRFYEINPQVLELSDKYFTYRKDSKAKIEVVLGDARVSLDRERQQGVSQQFDVIAVDAFSSDAIPVHLLTRECFQTYRYHLKKDGILAFHVTNRYFDLKPIVRNLVPDGSMQAIWIDNPGSTAWGTDHTHWVLLTSNAAFLANPEVQGNITPWSGPAPPLKFWTDDYSDLISVLHERKDGN
jgi:hypothetical protein